MCRIHHEFAECTASVKEVRSTLFPRASSEGTAVNATKVRAGTWHVKAAAADLAGISKHGDSSRLRCHFPVVRCTATGHQLAPIPAETEGAGKPPVKGSDPPPVTGWDSGCPTGAVLPAACNTVLMPRADDPSFTPSKLKKRSCLGPRRHEIKSGSWICVLRAQHLKAHRRRCP